LICNRKQKDRLVSGLNLVGSAGVEPATSTL